MRQFYSNGAAGVTPLAGLLAAGFLLSAQPAAAEWVTVATPVRAGVVLERAHLSVIDGPRPPGAVERIEDAVGQEARISLYPGRPVRAVDLGPPTLVRRNDIVQIVFRHGAMSLESEGRALGNGGLGERIQVMNLDSRLTVWGSVAGPNLVEMR